jgi:hypothetical protein
VDNTGDLPDGVVAMGQAFWFWVGVDSTNLGVARNVNLVVKEDAKVLGGTFYREKGPSSEQLFVTISNGQFKDNTFFKINPNATEGFDVYDGYKKRNEMMDIYLLDKGNNPLVMHTLSKLNEKQLIPIGIEVKEAGEYTISFSNFENFSYGNKLYFVDLEQGISMPVNALNSSAGYTVTLNAGTVNTTRFALSNGEPEISSSSLAAYPNPFKDRLNLGRLNVAKTKVSFTDMMGLKTEMQIKGSNENAYVETSELKSGLYILRVLQDGQLSVKKVVKQ